MPDGAISIRASLHGPLFEPGVRDRVGEGIDEALDLVALRGEALVKGQLYAGHGVRTGHLRRSIHGGIVRHLHAQIDAGAHQQGANVSYAEFVETGRRKGRATRFPGYGMFAEAYAKLSQLDFRSILAERITRRFR